MPKPVNKIYKRLFDFLVLFTQLDWYDHLRGKDRAAKYLLRDINSLAVDCRSACREDLADDLVRTSHRLIESAKCIVNETKGPANHDHKLNKVNENKVWSAIEEVRPGEQRSLLPDRGGYRAHGVQNHGPLRGPRFPWFLVPNIAS